MDSRQHIDAGSVYQEILRKLNKLRAKEGIEQLLTGALLFALGILGVLLFAIALEALIHLSVPGRTALFWLVALSSGLGFVWLVLRPLLRWTGVLKNTDDETLARKAGEHFPNIKDRLLNLLQLHREKQKEKLLYSPELIDAAFMDLKNEVSTLDFSEAVSYQRPKQLGKMAAGAGAVTFVIFLIFSSGFLDAAHRLAHFRSEFAAPPRIQFVVEPGNAEVIRGDDVHLSVSVEGMPVESIALFTRLEGEVNFARTALKKDARGKFSYEINSIKQSTDYYVQAQGTTSEQYKISVLDRPAVKNLRLHLTYPAYLALPPRSLDDNVGDVTALVGTKIDVELRANKELAKAALVFDDGNSLSMKVAGEDASGRLILSRDRAYHLLLVDKKGIENSDPIEYQLRAIRDEEPTVSIVFPGRDIDLADERRLPLFLKVHDDFGFSRLRLGYRLVHSRYERPAEDYTFVDIPLQKPSHPTVGSAVDLDISYTWNLKPLNLVTEDVVSYFAEVYDNDAVSGPKVGRSPTFSIRVPSLDEIFADVEKSQQETLEDLKSAAEDARELRQQLEQITQDLKKSREQLNWEKQKQTQELLKKYAELQKSLEETNRKLDQVIEQMEQNRLLSPGTLEKYLELQKLLEQLNSPELREAMKKLQDALRNMNPDQWREALQKFSFNEEMFRQSLERTLSLLRRIQIEQKLEEALKRAAELLDKQKQINEETQQTTPSDTAKREELAQRQRDAKEDLGSLEKELGGLEQRMGEFPSEMPLEEMQKLLEQLTKQQLGQKMEQSAEELQSGNMGQCQAQQRDLASALEQLLKQLQQVQKSMQQRQQQQIVRDLKKILQDLLELSKNQEALKKESESLEPNSQQFRETAQEQMKLINELSKIIEETMKLSRRTLAVTPTMGKAMGKALRGMSEAMEGIQSRNGVQASQQQGEAMGALNEAAAQTLNSLQAMMQGEGGGLQMLLRQLGEMIGQQQQINAGTQQLGQTNAMTMEQQAEMARLAAQQAAVMKSLQELNEEARRSAERERILGDLGKIGEEMREVVRDLEQKNVNPQTLQRQERILSRLLDAERSMRERDFEKRRKAEPGKDVVRKTPGDLDLTTQEGKNRLMQDLLKALEQGYTKDYEELIRKYFEALQRVEVGERGSNR